MQSVALVDGWEIGGTRKVAYLRRIIFGAERRAAADGVIT